MVELSFISFFESLTIASHVTGLIIVMLTIFPEKQQILAISILAKV